MNWTLGHGTEMMMMAEGNYAAVESSPELHDFIVVADVPLLLPLDSGTFDIHVLGNDFKVLHERKARGQELFSTLDSDALPVFSSLRIRGRADVKLPEPGRQRDRFYRIIEAVARKFDGFLRDQGLPPVVPDEFPELSYRVAYLDRISGRREPVAVATYPYSGPVRLPRAEQIAEVDEAGLRRYLAQQLDVERFARTDILPRVAGVPFRSRVEQSLMRFAFYCRQHAKSLHGLNEPDIGGLYLVIAKTLFGSAEGEAFHYDGKLDFKITNPDDFAEFVTGEFKWWTGPSSFEEAFGQITRKHATGQESALHLVVLSRARTTADLAEKIGLVFDRQPEAVPGSLSALPRKESAGELVLEAAVTLRGRAIPLRISVVDLQYHRV